LSRKNTRLDIRYFTDTFDTPPNSMYIFFSAIIFFFRGDGILIKDVSALLLLALIVIPSAGHLSTSV